MSEEDVQAMFTPYGRVEDVSILRNAEGFSKGGFSFTFSLWEWALSLSLSLSVLKFVI